MRPLSEGERERVAVEAKSWVGTPYHHLADVKGPKGGVDCAMLLVRVYTDLGFAPKFDPRPYSTQWYLHRSEELYLGWIEKYCVKVDGAGEKGDIALYRFGRCAAHGAIIIDDALMVHAYAIAKQVQFRERRAPMQRGVLDSVWSPRIKE